MSAATIQNISASGFSSQFDYILSSARTNAKLEGLNYAGDLTPQQAWALFSAGAAEIVDVRTDTELQRVGYVQDTAHVEWLSGPQMQKNPHFISQIEQIIQKDEVVLLLCRSGKRSVAAAEALTRLGYSSIFNILEGFEGDNDPLLGWLNHDLPVAHH
jgi:rhodanese-related sulfurtransferase